MSAPAPFDLAGPLPTGTSVVEASAGTGKTYTIARLVSRYVAEGAATMDELLVVSFSEKSSRELRDRVRERLVHDRDSAVGIGRDRLDRALADFDGAMVTTTHGFCNAILRELGTAADHDRDAALQEDPSDVVGEVSDDLYVRKWGQRTAQPAQVSPGEMRELAKVVALDPGTPLVPVPDETSDEDARLRARIAVAVREEVARRLRAARSFTYDDMVLRLDAALQDPDTAELAAARMRRRFSIVLVDEFQDTDPVQWRILRTAFHGHATLVLVGDPKQAIYGFRGADVHAYLEARRDATTTATLPSNYRSDPVVLDGLAALFGKAALGHPEIRVLSVVPARSGRMLDAGAPVRLRVVQRAGRTSTNDGTVPVAEARAAIRDDVARHVVDLLSGPARLVQRDGAVRAVHPGDMAVIVRSNAEAELIRARLRDAGVPAVVSGRSSVFATEAAEAWQRLLEALEQPHRTSRVRRLALGPLVGRTAETLDGDLEDLSLRLRLWLRVLDERGVAALFGRVQVDLRLEERLLAQPGGERLLTDLRHVAEALHEESLREGLGLTALASWLARRRTGPVDQLVERSRRLETDAAAVQVLTSHVSKGLEFPVVLAPSLWDHFRRKEAYPRFHDARGRRVRDIGGASGPEHGAHVLANQQESADEELRLAYVTLTRAAALAVAWWAPTRNTDAAPLHRLLMHQDPTTVAPLSVKVPNDADALARVKTRAAGSNGALEVSVVPEPGTAPVGTWTRPAEAVPALSLATFDRDPDLQWRRTSYSALTHAAHEATYGGGLVPGPVVTPAFASEPETGQKDDEVDLAPEEATPAAPDGAAAHAADPDAPLLSVASSWQDLPGGTTFGTVVHRVMERYEPGGDVEELVGSVARGQGIDVAGLAAGLRTALATPLGPLAQGETWADIAAADRLPELDFELPLAGGDAPGAGSATLAGLADLWREHVPDGVLAEYSDVLAQLPATGPAAQLRGYLTGSIDAVVRVRPKAGPGAGRSGKPAADLGERYLVVDHKTNRLAAREEPLTAWHYRTAALERSMIDAHYPLQALIYVVALHRYLRWRRRGYDPDQHLGGVLYLFLRGMSGRGVVDSTGAVPGVFAWRPPAQLVVGFSDLLAGETPRRILTGGSR